MRPRVVPLLCALACAVPARASACEVKIADGQIDSSCLPAFAGDGRSVAVPKIDPDGERGLPNLVVEILPLAGGEPALLPVISADEVNQLDGELGDKARARMAPRLAALNHRLADGHFRAARHLETPSGPADLRERFTVRDGALEIKADGPRVVVRLGGAPLTELALSHATTGHCTKVNRPFVDGLWLPDATPPRWLLVRVTYHGNDRCSEPMPAFQLVQLAPGDGAAPAATAPTVDAHAAALANDRGMALYRDKKLDDAAHEFRAAIAADPGHVKAHYNLACVASLLGDRATVVAELGWLARSDDPAAREKLVKGRNDPDLAAFAKDAEVRKLLDGKR